MADVACLTLFQHPRTEIGLGGMRKITRAVATYYHLLEMGCASLQLGQRCPDLKKLVHPDAACGGASALLLSA